MNIKILYDKDAINKKLQTGWGISFLINKQILFDTGDNGRLLLKNIKLLNVNINKIESIVVSHNHYDHTGGLWEILKKKENLMVYVCSNFGKEFDVKVKKLNACIIETEKLTEISKDVFVIGKIKGKYNNKTIYEQALIVKTSKGMTVITGCSHPGIINIVKKVKRIFPNDKLNLVFGGFHLKDKRISEIKKTAKTLKSLKVNKIGPTHCSGDECQKQFKNEYGKNYISIKVGKDLNV